jgi:hypothetical protein
LLDIRMEFLGYKPFKNMPKVIRDDVLTFFQAKDIHSLYLWIWTAYIDADKVISYIYHLKHDNYKYASIVSLKITFKSKNHKNINALFDVFHNLDIHIVNIHYKWLSTDADINVKNLDILHELLAEVWRLPNVSQVKRRFTYRVWIFLSVLWAVSTFILMSPAMIFFIDKSFWLWEWIHKIMFFLVSGSFLFLLYFFKYIARVTLPWLLKRNTFWIGMFFLNTFILWTVIWEALYVFWSQNSVFFFSLTMLLYGLTLFEYSDSKELSEKE